MNSFVVIMAGGSGTRFWPKSSEKKPKQFLSLCGKDSLITQTFKRISDLAPAKNRWVICHKSHVPQVKKHLGKINILAEPEARNTMAAACWSAWEAYKKSPDAVVAMLPADAFIDNKEQFVLNLKMAFEVAHENSKIVCIGIRPTYPATGYGYIESASSHQFYSDVKRFIEKPPLNRAEEYIHSTNFYWNAGIFVFSARVFIQETKVHAPEFYNYFEKFRTSKEILKNYNKLPKLPVDIALMEKTSNGAVIPATFGWSDVGSWAALEEVFKPGHEAGVVRGPADCISLDSSGNIIDVQHPKAVALIGVKNLVIVETDGALLICEKSKSQELKKIVEKIGANKTLAKKYL